MAKCLFGWHRLFKAKAKLNQQVKVMKEHKNTFYGKEVYNQNPDVSIEALAGERQEK